MKMNKRITVILMSSLIVATGVFTHNFYINRKVQESNPALGAALELDEDKVPYVTLRKINNSQVDIKSAEENKTASEEAVKPEPKVVAQNTGQAKQKPTLSRGGEVKLVVPPTKQSKPVVNNTAKAATINGYTADEVDLFSRLVSAESEGESLEGKLAVATVIINRVKSSIFPNTITGVVYDKSYGYQQFTPVKDGRINNPATSDSKKAVDMVLNGHRSFGSNILFFLNPKTSSSSWITQNKTYYQTIGNHQFYY